MSKCLFNVINATSNLIQSPLFLLSSYPKKILKSSKIYQTTTTKWRVSTNMDVHEYFPLKISLFVYQVHYILFLYKVQQKHDHHTFALINLCNQMLCNEKM